MDSTGRTDAPYAEGRRAVQTARSSVGTEGAPGSAGDGPRSDGLAPAAQVAGPRYLVRRRPWPWALVRPDIGDSPWAGYSGGSPNRTDAADLDLAWTVVRVLLRPAELLLAVLLVPFAEGLRRSAVLRWPIQVVDARSGRLVHEESVRGRENSEHRLGYLRAEIDEGMTFEAEPYRPPRRGL